jgi:photosystem II stability/assembly factor-like uncharacterized protein
MRTDIPDFERGFDPGPERDLDTQLRLFFRQAARPAVPLAVELAIERLPDRLLRDRIGLPGSQPFVRPMTAALVALSIVLAIATTAGLLDLRGGLPSAPSAPAERGTPTRIPLEPISRSPRIEEMGRFDANTGWVEINALDPDGTGRSSSYVRWTGDGGKTWSERRPVPLPDMEPDAVQFVDASHGWSSSYDGKTQKTTLWRTSDGGLTWQGSPIPLDAPSESGFFERSVHFRDPVNGEAFEFRAAGAGLNAAGEPLFSDWACEQFSTSDGGVTWSAPRQITCMTGIRFVDGMLGYAYDYFGKPVLYVTLDGGQTWTTGTLPADAQGSKYQIPMLLERRSDGTLRALVSGAKDDGTSVNAIVVSGDAGRTWAMAGTPSTDEATTERYGLPLGVPLTAMDENRWLTAPLTDDNGTSRFFESSDAGLTWKQVAHSGISGEVSNFNFLNASDGWAATDTYETTAALWATTDGGATWTRILSTP